MRRVRSGTTPTIAFRALNGSSAVTGKETGDWTVQGSQGGGSFTNWLTPVTTEIGNGWYYLIFDEMNTVEADEFYTDVVIRMSVSGADDTYIQIQVYQEHGPTTWYVDSGATGDGTGYDWPNAFTTISAAVTAASDGDTIYLKRDTTFTENVIVSKQLHIKSEQYLSGNIKPASGIGLVINARNCILEGLRVQTDDTVQPALDLNADQCTLIDCRFESEGIAVDATSCNFIEAKQCGFSSDRIAMQATSAIAFTFIDCWFQVIGDYTASDVDFIAYNGFSGGGSNGDYHPVHHYFRNCSFSCSRSNVSALNRETTAFKLEGFALFDNCNLYAESTNATHDGNVYCAYIGDAQEAGVAQFNNCAFEASTSGGGLDIDVQTENSASSVVLNHCKYTELGTNVQDNTKILTDLLSPANIITALLATDVSSEATASTIGLALHHLLDTSASTGVFSSASLANVPINEATIAKEVTKYQGSQLTIASASTTTTLNVTAETNIDATHLENALLITNMAGKRRAITRIDTVTGTAPSLTLTVSPALPETPSTSDTFIVGPKYLTSGDL